MIWLQGAVAFLIWVGYGIVQFRRSYKIRRTVDAIPRARRSILGAALLVLGAMVLIGGLGMVLQNGGFTSAGMTPAAWFAVTILGLTFVHAQTLGASMLVSLIHESVTKEHDSASINTSPGDRKHS